MPRHRYASYSFEWRREGIDRQHQRRSEEPDRVLVLNDSEAGGEDFPDEVGDDRNAFQARAYSNLAEILNVLGEHGWLVVAATAQPNPIHPDAALINSDFLLMRTE